MPAYHSKFKGDEVPTNTFSCSCINVILVVLIVCYFLAGRGKLRLLLASIQKQSERACSTNGRRFEILCFQHFNCLEDFLLSYCLFVLCFNIIFIIYA
jgi:hypothetical protein